MDQTINFLRLSEQRSWPMWLAAPLMRFMVESVRLKRSFGQVLSTNHVLFDGLGEGCRKIKEGAASWRALEIIYNHKGSSLADWFWIGFMRNAQAVRNRKRIIVRKLRMKALEIARRKGNVKVLSLASGSAQAVFEALKNFSFPLEVKLIDIDKEAGEYALKLSHEYRLGSVVSFMRGNMLKFDKPVLLQDFRPDIIEMAGLLDYLRDDEAVALIKRIYAQLPPGGTFITCHIHDNPERDFMTEVINWGRDDGRQRPMLYRTQDELVKLVHEGGFNTIVVYVEKHEIHSVAVAQK